MLRSRSLLLLLAACGDAASLAAAPDPADTTHGHSETGAASDPTTGERPAPPGEADIGVCASP